MSAPAPGTVPTWLDDIRLEPGPPFATMGTRALDLDDWLIVDDDRDDDLAYKARLFDDARAVVFACDGAGVDSRPPSQEVLQLVRVWLGHRGIDLPPLFGDEHPLIEAARLVQEDLAVLQRIEDSWVLTAGAVCFPSHWTIGDKVGLPLEGVHAPVAHYATELRDKVDRFHDRLTTDRPVWRRNWFVNPTSELHLPAYGHQMHIASTIEPDGSPMWIRSEYQTLRRLPDTGAILFTIRVQRAPLGVLRSRPDVALRMLAAVQSWDRDKRMYTSTGGALDALIDWLGGVAQAA
ncbi:MAG: hypothetical protein JWL72_4787 [Ilumatobacteraceae bacterium]|nr:hypothetical protein [Ilumatobacteraceae bacterium]MCU1391449.1 hypothetical protein [Ilumatobacteraceae bacterium]